MNGESDLDGTDRRLIAALQLGARVGVERLATVLGTSPRIVTQRLNRLLAGGAIRLTVTEPPTATEGVLCAGRTGGHHVPRHLRGRRRVAGRPHADTGVR